MVESKEWLVRVEYSYNNWKTGVVEADSEEEAIDVATRRMIEDVKRMRMEAVLLADHEEKERREKKKRKDMWEKVEEWAYSNDECLFRRVDKDGVDNVFRYFDPDIYNYNIDSVEFSNNDEMTISSENRKETWSRIEVNLENILILFSEDDEGDDELHCFNVSGFLDFARDFFEKGSLDHRFKQIANKAFDRCLNRL